MRYLFAGLIAGALAGILLFQGSSASEIVPAFFNSISSLELPPNPETRKLTRPFTVAVPGGFFLLDSDGRVIKKVRNESSLIEMSGDGSFYVQYTRTGTTIELLGVNGERYWQKESREKPFISSSGKLIFLLNGDHSGIRLFDTNGNVTGAGVIAGRLCTAIEFSDINDYGACGFVDGSYYFVRQNGNIINSGLTPAGTSVKGIRVSNNGEYGFIHYGTAVKDGVRIVNIKKNSFDDTALETVHSVRTAMNISDKGYGAILENESVTLFDDDCDVEFKIRIPRKRAGYASISENAGVYALGYTKATGESQFVFFRMDGKIFFAKEFPGESFLNCNVRDGSVFLRGSDNLFAYSFLNQ